MTSIFILFWTNKYTGSIIWFYQFLNISVTLIIFNTFSQKCPKEAHVGDNVKFVISFDNPIDKPLTGCSVSMDSVGFEDIDDALEK